MLASIAEQINGSGFCDYTPLKAPDLIGSNIDGSVGVVAGSAKAMFATIMANGKRSISDN